MLIGLPSPMPICFGASSRSLPELIAAPIQPIDHCRRCLDAFGSFPQARSRPAHLGVCVHRTKWPHDSFSSLPESRRPVATPIERLCSPRSFRPPPTGPGELTAPYSHRLARQLPTLGLDREVPLSNLGAPAHTGGRLCSSSTRAH